MAIFIQELLVGLAIGSVYALVALGYSLVFSTLRVVNFTQGHLVMLSSLIVVTLWIGHGWPLGLAILASTLILMAIGFFLEKGITIPMRGSVSPLVWIIVTLAAAVIIENVAGKVFGKETHVYHPLISGANVKIAGASIQRDYFLVIGAALLIMLVIDQFLKQTVWGKAVQATSYSTWVPRLMGVPVPRVVTISFVLSGLLGGLAGPLIGPIFGGVSTVLGFPLGLLGFIAVVLGGMGSTRGALVGGLTMGLAQTFLRRQLPPGLGNGAIFFLLILLLIVRPAGLFGRDWGRSIGGAEALA